MSEREFYIGGSTLLCQFIELVTFARLYLHCGISYWVDILIHVETLILEHLRHDVWPETYTIESVDSISRDERDAP